MSAQENAKSKSLNFIIYALGAICVLLFVADFFYKKKSYFEYEGLPGFYAIAGFGICFCAVIFTSIIRRVLARDEDYYAPNDVETEAYPEAELGREKHDV